MPSGPPHHDRTWELDESELAAWLDLGHREIAGCRPKVLVSHAPPSGIRLPDDGRLIPGSTAVRDGALRYGFDLVICGHIHEARGVVRLEDQVTVVNCGPACEGYYVVVEFAAGEIAVRLRTVGSARVEESRFPLFPGCQA